MKTIAIIGALFVMGINAIARDAWINRGGFVRWDKPTTIELNGLPIFNVNHSPADLEAAGYTYISNAPDCDISEMVIDYQAGTIRELTQEEKQAAIDAQYIQKQAFIVEVEKQYTNLLTQVGLNGVWANHDYSYEQVGLSKSSRGLIVEMLLADKLYGILFGYYSQFGGTDLRDYPWGSNYISEPILND